MPHKRYSFPTSPADPVDVGLISLAMAEFLC